ncbi:Photosystem II reaction center W protein [Hibiscus syriacus]|uniref:PSII 6.1 kDa protein n=1 Tax=Hibiscus syriacus TaxID=106335 RepID=A0A6A3CNB5_HIBSY|nr:photosystem II reaction center W protein, chloroplastic-like [Hibiscus syriacus]KAE8730653.1 Photosystem II reaction center W protein [Hibiscus syriacus]
MATISATAGATPTALEHNPLPRVASPVVIGLPTMTKRGNVKMMCSMEKRTTSSSQENGSAIGTTASLLAAACAATVSSPAMALVDERMSTEGTGLPFGLSNNLLGWILFGIFGLIWALYFVYTSSLEEDEESGLSL